MALLDLAIWQQIIELLEDMEDAEDCVRLRETGEEAVPWEQAKEELRAQGIDV
jgi:hypothetical protein